jgi:hypothetical protein
LEWVGSVSNLTIWNQVFSIWKYIEKFGSNQKQKEIKINGF